MTTFTIELTQQDLERLQLVAEYDKQEPYEYLSENIREMMANDLYLIFNKDFIEAIEKEVGLR